MSTSTAAAVRPALVTGASRGLGRGIAIALAALGHPVIVNYLANAAAAQTTVATIVAAGGRALAIAADVAQQTEVARLVAEARAAFGPIAIAVNNAGIGPRKTIDEITLADFDAVMASNLRSSFMVTQAVVPDMRALGYGRLLFLSSTAARIGGIVSPAYAASKAGMEGLMHFYATHLLKDGITANAIAPALIETDMVAGIAPPAAASLPLGRFGRVEEVNLVAQMLVQCEYMTGQTIQVNAGRYHT
jgi:3-oxoacyl-[acyl-carrier protein] reductase